MNDDQVFEELRAVVDASGDRDLNEADTRKRLIDLILHEVLSWPTNRVNVEQYIRPGYADYVLSNLNGEPIILVEAKREGLFFNIPHPYRTTDNSAFISLQKLMTDPAIHEAVTQVRTYCVDIGCEYAAITNGHEWIFFKTFEKSQKWETLRAFVVTKISYFLNDFTNAINTLSYTAIADRASLFTLLTSSPPKDRTIYYPRDRVPVYSRAVASNRLASVLRPKVGRYFGVIDDQDPEFMRRCYVSQRDDKDTMRGMRTLLQDSLTPYFTGYGVKQLHNDSSGGQLIDKIAKAVKLRRKGEVLVLFGGKGAGKSTFVKRLLHHETPAWLRDHSLIAIIDLLNVPGERVGIRASIWDGLISTLDRDKVLDADRNELTLTIFKERFEVALRQDLAGLPESSEAYNVRLNTLLSEWKRDKQYCAERLVRGWQLRGKGTVVVLDNTDQYSGEIQDFCFTSAQEIAETLGCTVLISMREERFYNSKMHGVLDAFQNSGFHISSPRPAEVFRKRIEYTVERLNDTSQAPVLVDDEGNSIEEASRYLKVVDTELRKQDSHLTNFLTACAHGDTRLSLDLFRSFLLSGYTNVDEILNAERWDFQIHQVLKPVMVPTRFFYDESVSDIPNIFQLRNNRHCSHFTAMRVLRKLAKHADNGPAGYVAMTDLNVYFAETFNMLEDMQLNVDVLLKRGFIEAKNRLDYFSNDLDDLKITPYGVYMLNDLSYYFSYLDLICIDCGVFDQQLSNLISETAREEYDPFTKRDRSRRIELRLDRVERFIAYLAEEEERERELYKLTMPKEDMFSSIALGVFAEEKKRVAVSAGRRGGRR